MDRITNVLWLGESPDGRHLWYTYPQRVLVRYGTPAVLEATASAWGL